MERPKNNRCPRSTLFTPKKLYYTIKYYIKQSTNMQIRVDYRIRDDSANPSTIRHRIPQMKYASVAAAPSRDRFHLSRDKNVQKTDTNKSKLETGPRKKVEKRISRHASCHGTAHKHSCDVRIAGLGCESVQVRGFVSLR